jgi:glycosyltransferase involved in cell wall biosynthesis
LANEQMDRIPVILAGLDCLGGVTTWMKQLRASLADHPRYDVRLLHVELPFNPPPPDFDLHARSIEHAREIIRGLAPAVVIPNYVWDLYLSACDPGIKCLAFCHSDSQDEYYRPLAWFEPLISQLIAVSPECRRGVIDRLSWRADDVTLLPYGVPVKSSLDRPYQTEPLRLIYAGRMAQFQKRVWDFVPLVEELTRSRIPFVFDVYGDGNELPGLKAAIEKACPHAPVNFRGRVSREALDEIWPRYDVFIQTSDFEGTSISMLEAMSHGVVPVVTAARSGVAGVIRHGENGFVVPVGDMAALARTLGALAADQPGLAAAGRAAHQTAKGYSLENYCGRFAEVLDRVVAGERTIDSVQTDGQLGGLAPHYRQDQTIAALRAENARLKTGGDETLWGTLIRRFHRPRSLQGAPSMLRKAS